MKVKDNTDKTDEEEEEEEQMVNSEQDIENGFVNPMGVIDVNLFTSCSALQKWNALPLEEGERCPCLERHTQMRCANLIREDTPAQLVKSLCRSG